MAGWKKLEDWWEGDPLKLRHKILALDPLDLRK